MASWQRRCPVSRTKLLSALTVTTSELVFLCAAGASRYDSICVERKANVSRSIEVAIVLTLNGAPAADSLAPLAAFGASCVMRHCSLSVWNWQKNHVSHSQLSLSFSNS